MINGKLRRFLGIPLALVAVTALVTVSACTPAEAKALEGILEKVDTVNGEITVVTRDGKTVVLTIATEASVETEEESSTLETLQPGASVEIRVDKDEKVAQRIKARQAEMGGVIVHIDGNEITIESEGGQQTVLLVADGTRIEIKDSRGTLADLATGQEVEIKYDPTTRTALKIEVEEPEREASAAKWGIVEIRVTDPPPADVVSAVVYLSNIEVHRVSGSDNTTSDNVSGEWIQVIGAPTSFDLMDVIGVEQVLGSANITAGRFTQIRMDVDRVEVVTTSGDNITAEVPGGKLKIVRPFNVGGGAKTVLTLDFDGEKSLVLTGRDGAAGNRKALFKPVVKLLIEKDKGVGEDEEDEAETEEAEESEDGGGGEG
ncbi:MAG: DUF4382 domain-containing protein [Dehalococcoidales bacterium]|nr:DUF4382 domain-containing protein [Dehalococcoidales bacterium]